MERYVIRGGSAGYQRLQLLARRQRPGTLEVLRLAGVRPGMRCLDLGCGNGDVDLAGHFCDPPNEGFRFYVEKYQQALKLNGGDPDMARKLFRCFLTAGRPGPQVRMTQDMDTDPDGDIKLIALSTLEATMESITSAGLATVAEAE